MYHSPNPIRMENRELSDAEGKLIIFFQELDIEIANLEKGKTNNFSAAARITEISHRLRCEIAKTLK